MKKLKIGEITNPINGKTIKSSDWTSSGVPIIRIQNLNNRKSEFNYLKKEIEPQYMVNTGELLFAWSGTIGAFFWEGPRAALNQHIFRLPLDESKTDKAYFYYSLNFIIESLKSQMQGSAGSLMHITKSKFVDTEIPHPPLPTQKIIASKIKLNFDLIEQGIAKLEDTSQKLQTFKQSILNSAVRGKLVPQDPKDESAFKLLERIQNEKEKLIADKKIKKEKPIAPIGKDEFPFDLPAGWELARLSDICLVQGGIQKQPQRAPKKNKFPFLRVANVYSGYLKLDEIHEVELFGDELEKLRLKKGDLLIVEGNGSPTEIGRMAKWNDEINDAVHQNHLIRARPILIDSDYISYVWNSPFGRAQIFERAKSSSGLYTLSTSKVSSILIPVPPLKEQVQIVSKVKESLAQIDNLTTVIEESLGSSSQLKQSILKKAFEGEL